MDDIHMCDDPDEKCNMILERDTCQRIELDILYSS